MPRKKRRAPDAPSPNGRGRDQPSNPELAKKLEEFTKHGVPPLQGYEGAVISNQSLGLLMWVVHDSIQLQFHVSNWRVSPREAVKQAVICELIQTEADYVFHLLKIVELFLATAHALQDNGFLLEIETERLFTNLPDVLAASLYFWTNTFYPMLSECLERRRPFRVDQMAQGFTYFKEHFRPYEKYVYGQNKNLDYLRSLSNNQDFMAFLSWCYTHMDGHKLQLIDIMVKPMQRITKYPLILQRILDCTENEHERILLEIMIKNAKGFVLDINRVIRQRDEQDKLDELANSIETFDVFFREEDMDKCFKMFAHLNLKAPMHNCAPGHNRCLVFQGDLRFRDNTKETDVKIFLLTDMLLICKKTSKGGSVSYKMIRPKYMVDKMHPYSRYKSNTKEMESLVIVVVDEVGTAYNCFTLLESSKEDKNQGQLKTVLNLFASKLKEAKICYELAVWYTQHPFRDLSEIDLELNVLLDAAANAKLYNITSDEVVIEKDARERVATMLHGIMNRRRSEDSPRITYPINAFDITHAILAGDLDRIRNIKEIMHRVSISESTRTSRLSSFHKSVSTTSYDEPHPGPSRIYRPSSSIEHVPVQLPEEDVNLIEESEDNSDLTVQTLKANKPIIEKCDTKQLVPQQPITQLPEDQSETSTNLNQYTASRPPILRPQVKHPLKIMPPVHPIQLDEQSIMQIPMTFMIPSPIRILPSLHRGVPTLTSLVRRTNEIINNIQNEQNAQTERAQSAQNYDTIQRSHSPQSDLITRSDQRSQSAQSDHITQDDLSTSSAHSNQSFQSIQKIKSHPIRAPYRGSHGRRAVSSSPCTVRIQPQSSDRFMHSLPDLTIEPPTPRYMPSFSTQTQTASEKLYRTHNERLQKFRRPVGQSQPQQFLSPDDRSTNYPPSSPTRASLTRGMAFSYSFENQPFNRMGHAKSQTNLLPEFIPSTSRYSRSGSTSPVPDPSPGRRAKSASGSRSNRSGTTTHGQQETHTSQETEASQDSQIPTIITTLTDAAAPPTNASDLTDAVAHTDSVAPIHTEVSAIADLPKDAQDIKASTEEEALKYANTSKDLKAIQGEEMVKDAKDFKETEAPEDTETREDADIPQNADTTELAEASKDADASEHAETPEDVEVPADAEISEAAEVLEETGTLENPEACENRKDSKVSVTSIGVEDLKNNMDMDEIKNLVNKNFSENAKSSDENKDARNAEVLKEANASKDTKTQETPKAVEDTKEYEEAEKIKDTEFLENIKETNNAEPIKDIEVLKRSDIPETYMKNYEAAPQDDNQRPPGESGNQNNSNNIGPYDGTLMTQANRRDVGVNEDLEFFDQAAPGNEREDDQED